jgi:energy-coupling factor transporter ATP-binding protein EcfA2
MLRLTDLTIRSFQSADPTTLRFAPDANLLLGINGAGKSTLLTLLSALAQVDLSWVTEHPGAIDLEWGLELERSGEPTILARLTLRVDAQAAAGLRRRGEFGCALSGTHSGDISLKATLSGDVYVNGEQLDSPDEVDILVPQFAFFSIVKIAGSLGHDMSAVSPFIEAVTLPHSSHPIDEGLAAFDAITRTSDAPTPARRSFIIARPGGAAVAYETPADVVGEFMAEQPTAQNDPWRRPRPGLTRARIASVLGATDFMCHPRPGRRSADGAQMFEGFDLRVTWPDGSEDRAQDLSFGQKRIIAFFWTHGYRIDVPIFADELTNGLHASWVDACVDALAGQQSFHAVQNPLLVDRLGPGSADELERRFVLCSVTVRDGRRRWIWRNPTEDEASALRHAYDGGLQHLSELLSAQGLW